MATREKPKTTWNEFHHNKRKHHTHRPWPTNNHYCYQLDSLSLSLIEKIYRKGPKKRKSSILLNEMKWKTSCTATHHHHIKRKSFSIHLINFKEAMMMMMEKISYLFISFIFITISEHKQTKQKIGKISNQIKFLGCCFVL